MKYTLTILVTIQILIFIQGCGNSSGTGTTIATDETQATYQVTFTTTWDSSSHPNAFPSNAHFSPLIGLTHNQNGKIWQSGEFASPGIESMAETGAITLLSAEINKIISANNGFQLIEGFGIESLPGTTNTTFKVTKEFPMISLVTMIAPSPDWFVGINSFNLLENKLFIESKIIQLLPYDAGTDNGLEYIALNDDTQPREKIFEITDGLLTKDNQVKPIGYFTVTKVQQ